MNIKSILKRHEKGYTATLYGDAFTANMYMRHDFDKLVRHVKSLDKLNTLAGFLILDIEEHLDELHPIRHSNVFNQIKKHVGL